MALAGAFGAHLRAADLAAPDDLSRLGAHGRIIAGLAIWGISANLTIETAVGVMALGRKTTILQMKSERLLAFYENVRHQVENDVHVGGLYRFASEDVRQYAEELRKEIERRRLKVTPIDWPD